MNVDEDRSGKGTRESNGGWKMRKIYKYESIMKDYVINKKQQEILSRTKSDAFQDTVRISHDLICLMLSVSLTCLVLFFSVWWRKGCFSGWHSSVPGWGTQGCQWSVILPQRPALNFLVVQGGWLANELCHLPVLQCWGFGHNTAKSSFFIRDCLWNKHSYPLDHFLDPGITLLC